MLGEVIVEHDLRSTAERIERCTCLKVNDIRLVCSNRMPCLAHLERGTLLLSFSQAVPSQCGISLTQTKYGYIAVHAIEVGLNLCAYLGLAELIVLYIQTDT